MNSKRSYLDSLNAGRQRRPYATLEQLNRSLETLEQRIGQNRAEAPHYPSSDSNQTAEQPYDTRFADDTQPPAAAHDIYDQPYQSLARDIERVRSQEDGVAAFGKIAGELKGLREELRDQMSSGVRREFEGLRKDIERSYAAGTGPHAGRLDVEFERLSGAIQSLAEKSDDRSVNKLRLEIEQIKSALDTLAREETVLSVDRRIDDFQHRFASDPRSHAAEPEITALTSRLEQISTAVNNLPESLSLRSLEEKVRTLAAALDHFISQQGGRVNDTFGLIEERLDEISRAIVASTVAAQSAHLDLEPFERVEARISALAHQIEEVAEDRSTGEVIERLNSLSERVDDIAVRAALPEQSIEKLAKQIALIADKIDQAPAVPDAAEIFSGIEQRFDVLSTMIERRQGDAFEQGNLLFRELERRLDEVADKIDQRQAADTLDAGGIMNEIDTRFSALAQRLEERVNDGADSAAIRGLETRLEDISVRLDASAAQFAGIDPELIRNLESQVAVLSTHLARPSTPLPEFEDIGPRLDEIERSIAGNRETVLEAARNAAENAARSLAGSQADSAVVSGLADDLKALEALTRRSDERNGKTFEAIHDTLLKIVDRLGSMEQEAAIAPPLPEEPQATPRKMALQDAPSIDFDRSMPEADDTADAMLSARTPMHRPSVERSPAQAAAAAAMAALGSDGATEDAEPTTRVRSLFSSLSRAFGGKGKGEAPVPAGSPPAEETTEAAPSFDLDAPLDPKLANRPLEPGSGAPDLNAIMKRVREERTQPVRQSETDAAKSDFIAAARRAAQAAAAEAEVLKRGADIAGPVKALRVGDLLKSRRKPILMTSTAIIVALAGLQLSQAFMNDTAQVAALDVAPIMTPQPVETASLDEFPMPAEPLDLVDENIVTEAPAVSARMVEPKDEPTSATVDAAKVDATGQANSPTFEPSAKEALTKPAVVADTIETAALPQEPAFIAPTPALDVPVEAGPAPLREAANAGDAKALFEIASRYAEGRGGATDLAKAALWYEKSAELGFAPAQFRIGNFYEKGLGVTRDIEKSKSWYLKSAEQGNASAMHNLAVLFAMGADGATNNEAAARWFVRAAELGVKDSQFNLGILAAKGVGMPQSLEESYKWFALVAKTGDKDATGKRDEVAQALQPEQLERARAATELWKPKPLDPNANAVDIPASWQESQDKTASLDMKKAVQNIQLILNKNGYAAGQPDGVMGGKTKLAITAFQKDNALEPTGEVDGQLVAELLKRK